MPSTASMPTPLVPGSPPTHTDPYAVVASAVGTLAGPLRGGANEDILAMLEQVGGPENAGAFG